MAEIINYAFYADKKTIRNSEFLDLVNQYMESPAVDKQLFVFIGNKGSLSANREVICKEGDNPINNIISIEKKYGVSLNDLKQYFMRINSERAKLKEAAKAKANEERKARLNSREVHDFSVKEHPEIYSEVLGDLPPLEQLVAKYRTVLPKGEYFIAKSPFYNSDNYTMLIDPNRKLFVDYGISKSGNAIDFLSSIKNMTPEQYIKMYMSFYPDHFSEETRATVFHLESRVAEVMKASKKYFVENMTENKCVDYLHKRGFSDKTIAKFELGYATKTFTRLIKHLQEQDFTLGELIASGVVSDKEDGKCYDFFNDRAMIPIRNSNGVTVGFGGRDLSETPSPKTPKYLNSKTTAFFHKGDVLFNFDVAKNTTQPSIIVVEGFMDCISAYESGLDNVVAGCGTAFTSTYADLLAKTGKEVILAFDNDAAGEKAFKSAAELLENRGVVVSRLDMSQLSSTIETGKNAKDFNDLLVANGKFGIPNFLVSQNANVNAYNHFIAVAREQHNSFATNLKNNNIAFRSCIKDDKAIFAVDSRKKSKCENFLKKPNVQGVSL